MVATSRPDRDQIRPRTSDSWSTQVQRTHADPVRHLGRRPERDDRERDDQERFDIENEVAQTIESIERVVDNFSALKDNFRFYEELADDLRAKLDVERGQREQLDRELADMDRLVKTEGERAARAETSAKASEARSRDLEEQLSSLRAQTMRLVKAVTLLISTERESGATDTDRALRLVP